MNEKMDIINDTEFIFLFQKSKELIDNAKSNMGQMTNAIIQSQIGQLDIAYFKFPFKLITTKIKRMAWRRAGQK